MSIKTKCTVCNKDIEVCPSRFKNRINIFCSKNCESSYRKSINPNYIQCDNCGKLFYKRPSDVVKNTTHCCSRKCVGELRAILYKGVNNPNYNNKGSKNPMTVEFRITTQGYKLIHAEGHPLAIDGFWIKEHRLIAERFLMSEEQSIVIEGVRYLSPDLDVHHINLNKLDNSVSNLLILSKSEHMSLHHKLRRENL